MQKIDLTLAVNYIPACTCVIKLLTYLLLMSIMAVYDDIRTFVILGVVIYMDRVLQGPNTFLDGNSIIFTVYLSHVYQHIRTSNNELVFSVLLVYFMWGLLACVFLLDHTVVHKALRYLLCDIMVIQVGITAAIGIYLLFHTAQVEPYGCTIAKSLAYEIIVIIWIYCIGLKNHVTMQQNFTVRFIPLLILPIYMAVVLWIALMGILVWHVKQTIPELQQNVLPLSVDKHVEPVHQSANDDESLFRMARASAA
jgi:hypothetical protein